MRCLVHSTRSTKWSLAHFGGSGIDCRRLLCNRRDSSFSDGSWVPDCAGSITGMSDGTCGGNGTSVPRGTWEGGSKVLSCGSLVTFGWGFVLPILCRLMWSRCRFQTRPSSSTTTYDFGPLWCLATTCSPSEDVLPKFCPLGRTL